MLQRDVLYHVTKVSQQGKSGVLGHGVIFVFLHTAASWRMLGLEEVRVHCIIWCGNFFEQSFSVNLLTAVYLSDFAGPPDVSTDVNEAGQSSDTK